MICGGVENLLGGSVDALRSTHAVRAPLVEQCREVGAREALRPVGAVASHGAQRSPAFGPRFPDSRLRGGDSRLDRGTRLLRDRLAPRATTFKLDKFVTEPRHVGRSSPLVDVELRASLRPHAQHRRAAQARLQPRRSARSRHAAPACLRPYLDRSEAWAGVVLRRSGYARLYRLKGGLMKGHVAVAETRSTPHHSCLERADRSGRDRAVHVRLRGRDRLGTR